MTALSYAAFAFFPLAMAYAAASDLLTMTIPNRISLALVVGFAAFVPFLGLDLAAIGSHVAAGAIVLVITFAMFSFGWVGGGDAKIAAAAALWLGLDQTLAFIVQTCFLGGTLTFAILALRSRMLPAFAIKQDWLLRLHDQKSGVPYGIAIAGAALLTYPKTAWLALVVG